MPSVSIKRVLFQAFLLVFYCLFISVAYLRGGCIWVTIILRFINDAIVQISTFFVTNVNYTIEWFKSSPNFEDMLFVLFLSSIP